MPPVSEPGQHVPVVPTGLDDVAHPFPSDESLGYDRPSLRDERRPRTRDGSVIPVSPSWRQPTDHTPARLRSGLAISRIPPFESAIQHACSLLRRVVHGHQTEEDSVGHVRRDFRRGTASDRVR
jgi:hypothetical protein